MILETKLFNRFTIDFPVDQKVSIVIGPNGSYKSHTLRALKKHFEKNGERVLYFSDQRVFQTTKEEALKGAEIEKEKIRLRELISTKEKKKPLYEKYKLDLDKIDFEENGVIRSGFMHIVEIATKILLAKERPIVIIDEPEKNLHLRVQNELIQDLLGLGLKKLIVATHSPSIIGDFHSEIVGIEKVVKEEKNLGTA